MPATLEIDDEIGQDDELPGRMETTETDEFVIFSDVPIFKEHKRTITDDDGEDQELVFTAESMAAIVNRCNLRIKDTGDFVPVVILHNEDDDTDKGGTAADPLVIGIAGPFKLGTVGNLKPKAAVLAEKFRIYKEHAHYIKRYPRISVEYWGSKKNPTGGYLDPISLLGARTPELDLGMLRYSKDADAAGDLHFKYSKSIDSRICYAAEAGGAVSTQASGSNTYVPGYGNDDDRKIKVNYEKEPAQMALSREDIMQLVEAMTPVCKALVEEMRDEIKGELGGGAEPLSDQDADNMGGPSDGDADNLGEPDMGAGDRDGMEPEQYGADDELPPEGDAAPGLEEMPPEGDQAADMPPAEDKDEDEDEGPQTVSKYRKQRDEIRLKYKKLERLAGQLNRENQDLKLRVGEIEDRERINLRYKKISELVTKENLVCDVNQELEETKGLDDPAFETHLKRMMRYAKIPTNTGGYIRPTKHVPKSDEGEFEIRKKYSKEARIRVEKARDEGKTLAHSEALQQVYAEARERGEIA